MLLWYHGSYKYAVVLPSPVMKFRAIIEVDEDGMFAAECPTLPGCISQGKTRSEALANLKDAVEGYLASLRKHDEPIPPGISEEVFEVDVEASGPVRA